MPSPTRNHDAVLLVRVPRELLLRLDARAIATSKPGELRSRSEVVRELLSTGLKAFSGPRAGRRR